MPADRRIRIDIREVVPRDPMTGEGVEGPTRHTTLRADHTPTRGSTG